MVTYLGVCLIIVVLSLSVMLVGGTLLNLKYEKQLKVKSIELKNEKEEIEYVGQILKEFTDYVLEKFSAIL